MKRAITLGEGCIDNQPTRLANCSSIEMNTKIGENRRPSELVRLSFIESREKDKEKPHKRSNHHAALLSLTLYLPVSLVKLATLDLVTLDATARADVGCHTAFGIFFRLQVTDFDRLLGFFSLCHFIFY
jgi:hypothetical protein